MSSNIFLSIQASYSNFQLALFKGNSCASIVKDESKKASSILIPCIDTMLKDNGVMLHDLDFIAIDQGPGAFTSLRVAIATVNGLNFAGKIPLIGIDGLRALAEETINKIDITQDPQVIISLLNAYNNEVYYGVYDVSENNTLQQNKSFEIGYKKIDELLQEVETLFGDQKILFTGNGAILHKDMIEQLFGKDIIIQEQAVCSVEQVAYMGLKCFENNENLQTKLYPLYLKSQNFAIRSMPQRTHTS